MKNYKKLLSVSLVVVAMLSLTACGHRFGNNHNPQPTHSPLGVEQRDENRAHDNVNDNRNHNVHENNALDNNRLDNNVHENNRHDNNVHENNRHDNNVHDNNRHDNNVNGNHVNRNNENYHHEGSVLENIDGTIGNVEDGVNTGMRNVHRNVTGTHRGVAVR